jgi:hypothetical protein
MSPEHGVSPAPPAGGVEARADILHHPLIDREIKKLDK